MNPGAKSSALGIWLIALALLVLALGLALFVSRDPTTDSLQFGGLRFWQDPNDAIIFWRWRVPRVIAAALVGGGLALAGCALQSLLLNPLAEPFTLGISSGASLAAVVAIRFDWNIAMWGSSELGWAAYLGAGGATFAVWRLGHVARRLPPETLVLAGVCVATICAAATMAVQYTADFRQVYKMVKWMMGGLDTDIASLGSCAPPILLGSLVLVLLGRPLNAMTQGPELAASVGVNGSRITAIALAAVACIVGGAISLAGPIGFVGLLVPHVLRAWAGPDHRRLLPLCFLTGASFLVLCDVVARVAIAREWPVGVVTALFGGPFFLFTLMKTKR